jgi:anti-anti-sigma regulatory factor
MPERDLTHGALRIEVNREAGAVVISPVGALDHAGLPLLEHALRNAAQATDGLRVILDLGGATLADGDWLRRIAHATAALDGRLSVRSAHTEVVRELVVSGHDRRVRLERAGPRLGSAEVGAANVVYVRRIWDAFDAGGAQALVQLIPDDVIWRPASGDGRVLIGVREIVAFWETREGPTLGAREFTAVGEDVLVRRESPQSDGSVKCVWSLYRFDGPRLIEVVGSEQEPPAVGH